MRRMMIVGHVCVDLAPELTGPVRLEPGALFGVGPMAVSAGGCVGNTARALADLGHPVSVDAAVGDDELGRALRDDLRSPLIDVRARTVAASTSYSLVLQERGSDRTFWHHVGSNAHIDGTDIDVEGADVLHLGYPSLLPALIAGGGRLLANLLERARKAGVTTSVDLAVVDPGSAEASLDWRELLRTIASGADVLTPSLDDLSSVLSLDTTDGADLAEVFADLLIRWGAGVVAISAGADGLVVRTADARRLEAGGRLLAPLASTWANRALRIPAVPVRDIRTTNGAGDASTAAMLFGLSKGWSLEDTVSLARAGAAAVVSGRRPTPENVVEVDPDLAPLFPPPPAPEVLPSNQPQKRFYRGGERIAHFRGADSFVPHTPEDWVASTVTVRGEPGSGLTTLGDGRLLRDAIAEDPVGWLGAPHVLRYGADPKLLVKLLDAGQRLPVHAHPDAAFAAERLGASHGKTEAWHILTEGVVYLGLRRESSVAELSELVERQDTSALLSLLHEVRVGPGDRVLVPARTLHAIGEGVLLVEVQEPEDLSILLEWSGFEIDGAADGHLGIGFDEALEAVDTRAMGAERLAALVLRDGDSPPGLPEDAAEFFRLEAIEVSGASDAGEGFAVIVGVDGDVEIAGTGTRISRGCTVVIPAAHDRRTLRGEGVVLVARPPRA